MGGRIGHGSWEAVRKEAESNDRMQKKVGLSGSQGHLAHTLLAACHGIGVWSASWAVGIHVD